MGVQAFPRSRILKGRSQAAMIRTLADLLDELVEKGVQAIKGESEVKHGPTIGDMYEGLTRSLLGRSLPEESDIRVVTGFIEFQEGVLSSQQDCLVIRGPGRKLPYTDAYICPAQDVLAVVEVKATLSQSAIVEAATQLAELRKGEEAFWNSNAYDYDRDGLPVRAGITYASRILGKPAGLGEGDGLTVDERTLTIALINESRGIARIIYSPVGYKTHSGFRRALMSTGRGRTVSDTPLGALPSRWPTAILGGNYGMVKVNGRPYSADPEGRATWVALATCEGQSIEVLLEILWSKIALNYVVDPAVWGEDLDLEAMALLARVEYRDRKILIKFLDATNNELEVALSNSNNSARMKWEPVSVNADLLEVAEDAFVLPLVLDAVKLGRENVQKLLDSGLFIRRNSAFLISNCDDLEYISSGNILIFADNAGGRFDKWLMRGQNRIH